ncbi:hypothetical protein RN001_003861 [Aquatica leii]|uniref:Kinesin-like protein n=1 Tax=Aquatica leii TaxID=1421715 RepID=A0AAN7PG46_9COLE|nr:hypothetical protein RN001_003861 [Aquatica leii]
MDGSKLSVDFCTNPTNISVLVSQSKIRPRNINSHHEEVQIRYKRAFLSRGFNSCSDIGNVWKSSRSLKPKIGSEMNIHFMKTYIESHNMTNSFHLCDYKSRHNKQVESDTKLSKIDTQLFNKIKKYDVLMQYYIFLKINYDKALRDIDELQKEHDSANYAYKGALLPKHTDYEYFIEHLQKTANNFEEECRQLKNKNNFLESEREFFRSNNECLKQQNADLENKLLLQTQIIQQQQTLLFTYKENIQKLEHVRRSLHNQIQDLKGTIRVFCRVRPQLPSENEKSLCTFKYVDDRTLELKKLKDSASKFGKASENTIEFVFDKVFRPECTQIEVFDELSQLIQSAIDGYNVSVFAYGQTGSGKTFTMQGEENTEDMGMIPRSVNLIFKLINKYRFIGWTYTVKVSFLEIYNEMVRDLLNTNTKGNLDIMFNDGKGTTVKNLSTVPVQTSNDLHVLMQRANQNRAVAVTNFNEHSSRSHAVMKMTIIGTNTKSKIICRGSLNLVDLAGSESGKTLESGKTSERMLETKNINKSLTALGKVMMALQNNDNHIPYRNSKLTYLLQNSLGGNSKTLMFINIAPLEDCYSESISALRFATMVKEVRISSKKNKTYIK